MTKTAVAIPPRNPDRPLDLAEERWWVAKVKPRQEKQLAADFYHEDIEYYLPLYPKNSPRPGTTHRRIFHVPLFPGYLAFSQNTPHNIYRSGRVVNLIEVKNQRRFITELNQIYFALQCNAPLEPVTGIVIPGASVKIISGPFAGIEGKAVKNTNGTRLILSVESLGNALLTIDQRCIEEITPNI